MKPSYSSYKEASCSQALALLGGYNHPKICWKSSTESCRQSKRLLECIEYNFLSQVIESSTREDAILNLMVTNATELISDIRIGGSLGCSDHMLVEFPVLRDVEQVKNYLGSMEKSFIFHLLENNIAVWLMSTSSPFQHVHPIPDKLDKVLDHLVPPHLNVVTNTRNTAMYIFTSGTTGFPKAAIIASLRALSACLAFTQRGIVSQDIMYLTLPLYHISASLLGSSGCIELGAISVLKKKFSASQFWNDCRKYSVAMFLYIGELCHYRCNQPSKEEVRVHKVHIALGNGTRLDVWKEFLTRFGPIKIFEFCGSTEGNLSFLKNTNKIGRLVRASSCIWFLHSFELLKYDVWKQELKKDENGRCKKAPTDYIQQYLSYNFSDLFLKLQGGDS
ncbi:long-chain fatty acid transport protein 6-like [Caloenas nicobarica]|uniref:long-chain fatty acid transport protein 6-like n=1 Tax=Caloenas nicobarica TaxID=187106 RepID=UPI0032B8131C